MIERKQRVAILGASNKPERYSNKAQHKLQEAGHNTFLVNPKFESIDGTKCVSSIEQLTNIETLTVYVGPEISIKLVQKIIDLAPTRVILNPGTESEELKERLINSNIEVEEACTLVLLSTNQF